MHMKTKTLLLTFALSLVLAGKSLHAAALEDVDAYLNAQQFQGAALIAKEGRVLFSKGYGLANVEHQIPNTPSMVFRIGSLTKQFTAVAIVQLQEQGLLHVNDPINTYLPGYPQGNTITVHHLLSHSSGIPSITDFSNLAEIQRNPTTALQTLAHFKHLPLRFAPGTDCDYSDSGYIVLGAIIEAVAKTSYEDYIQTHILRPLGMHSTYYDRHERVIPQRASGYVKTAQGIIQHAAYLDMSFPHASGALASTVEDLYKWNRALHGPGFLRQGSLKSLFAVQASSVKNQITYSYGFRIGPRNRGLEECREPVIGHFGKIEGFEAAAVYYPAEDLTIILLSNVENTNVRLFHKELARLICSSWRPCATS